MLEAGINMDEMRVDLRLSVIKPLVPAFLEAGWTKLNSDGDLVKAAWANAGIDRCASCMQARAHQRSDAAQRDGTAVSRAAAAGGGGGGR